MRKIITEHVGEAILDSIVGNLENPNERIYSLILRDPDFITPQFAEKTQVRFLVQMNKAAEGGEPALYIHVEAFTRE